MLIVMDMNVGMGGNSTASVRLAVHSSGAMQDASVPVLTAEISKKPLISFLWAGTILLFLGLAISMYRRFTEETNQGSLSSMKLAKAGSGLDETEEVNKVEVQNVES